MGHKRAWLIVSLFPQYWAKTIGMIQECCNKRIYDRYKIIELIRLECRIEFKFSRMSISSVSQRILLPSLAKHQCPIDGLNRIIFLTSVLYTRQSFIITQNPLSILTDN